MSLIFSTLANSSIIFVVNVLLTSRAAKFECLQLLLDSGPRVLDGLFFALIVVKKPEAGANQTMNPWVVFRTF